MAEGSGSDIVVEIGELAVNFHGIEALKEIHLSVRRGEIFGIVGTNGAGKSTLIEVLSGMVRPSSGRVRVLGRDPIRQSGELRSRIGVVPQETSLEEKLTGLENILYFGRLLDVPADELPGRAEEIIRFMGLWGRRNDRLESYSVGMKRKVHFASSLIHRPELLLVDEATSGFDPVIKDEVSKLILKMARKDGITVILTTHDLSDARDMCDRLAVLHGGSLVSTGTWEEVSSSSTIKLFLGGISGGDEENLRKLVPPDSISERLGGLEVSVTSLPEALNIMALLEENDIEASTISYGIPTEEVFRELTSDSGDDPPVT